jgi:hypothetical protein
MHQCQCFINDGRYPHIVYVEEPKDQDVEFSDTMIYEAKTTSEMEGIHSLRDFSSLFYIVTGTQSVLFFAIYILLQFIVH